MIKETEEQALRRATSVIERLDTSDEEQFTALSEFFKIASKYDAHLGEDFRKETLNALEALRKLADTGPQDSRDEASKMLKHYNELLFPRGKSQ